MDRDDEYFPETGQLEGQYANHYRIGHNAFEFVIEFGQYYEGNREARFHTRIISNPIYAKKLLQLLSESIERYENRFGSISDDEA